MERTNRMGSSSSSSLASDLFGSKESSGSSSSGILSSIFAPSSKALGRESQHFEYAEKKQGSGSQDSGIKPGVQEWNKQEAGSFYQEQRMQPCHLSSSIYYGGQDIYRSNPQNNTQNSGIPTLNKDRGEDDSGSASRGNWWQGSLYY
ncbi:hypothetical protein NMG60_11000293 [Bertholletia excelsa]